MPTLPSSSFEPSPFTLPPSGSSSSLSAVTSDSSSVVGRRPYRKRELADSEDADDVEAERKRRRQEQNRKAAATSRVNNKERRDRLQQRVAELEASNQRLKRIRESLEDDNSSLTSSVPSSASSSDPSSASASSSSNKRVKRSSNRESAVLVNSRLLPWDCCNLMRNKPHIRRVITTAIALGLLLLLCTATIITIFSSSSSSTTQTAQGQQPRLPPFRASMPSSSSLLPPLLLSSLLSLSTRPPIHFSPPSLPLPTHHHTSPFSSHLSHRLSPPLLRVSSSRRRVTVVRPSAATRMLSAVAGQSVGISGEALAGVQLRAGRAVGERVWSSGAGGVQFRGQLRGTNASVSVDDRMGSPPWLLAMFLTAMVS